MKKLLVLFLSLMMVGILVGCDGDETSTEGGSNAVQNNEFEETATLQGTVFDATTGARLQNGSDTTLAITLIKDGNYISPAVLRNGTDETSFAGDFTFANVPVTLEGDATYMVVATLDGYQQFNGYVTLTVTSNAAIAGAAPAVPGPGGINNTFDTDFSFIGNVYMYPIGSTANDLEIYVEYNNERVVGATVQLQLLIGSNVPVAQTTRVLAAATGTSASLIATTDSNGLATFSGSTLALGGAYIPNVLPTTHETVQLALYDGDATTSIWAPALGPPVVLAFITTGTSIQTYVIPMADAEPNAQAEGLYIIYASNQDQQDVRSNGILDITFNRAIAIVAESVFTATMPACGGGDAALTADGADGSVVVTVVSDNTLRLTPQFTEAVETADINCTITYTGGQITLKADDEANTGVIDILQAGADDVMDLGGAVVDKAVVVAGPQD